MLISCGYVFDFTITIQESRMAFNHFSTHLKHTLSQFTFIGKLVLPLWLLIKGVNVAQWEKFALQPA